MWDLLHVGPTPCERRVCNVIGVFLTPPTPNSDNILNFFLKIKNENESLNYEKKKKVS
jgi:hypothetical protein